MPMPFKIGSMRFQPFIITVSLLLFSAATANPATHLGTQAPAEEREISAKLDTAQEVMMSALSLTGIKYTYGGSSPETGFDCSGFVRYVFQQAAGLSLPHGALALSRLGQPVAMDQLQPGDLVFFNTLKSAFSHVGIYLGNKRFIHAPSSGGGIHIVSMGETYWAKRFDGARRLQSESADPQAPSNQ
jgi:cell wall-associated NlpC family hydrolase